MIIAHQWNKMKNNQNELSKKFESAFIFSMSLKKHCTKNHNKKNILRCNVLQLIWLIFIFSKTNANLFLYHIQKEN